MDTKITAKKIDCKPEIDPYRRDTNGLSTSTLWIDPREHTCGIRQDWPGDNSTPAEEWHGLIVTSRLSPEDAELDPKAIREYIEGEAGQELLARICAGHAIEWNGSNHVGSMTDDASAALDEIVDELSTMTSGRESWFCGDWFGQCTAAEIGITDETTDEKIAEIAKAYAADAEAQNIHLIDDVADYLTNRRNALND
jgi:hypothetical protein